MLSNQEEQFIIALRQITQAIDHYSRYLFEVHGLSAPQIATLKELMVVESATPGRLADDLHLSPQTMAGILNRLEKRELVVRGRHETDGRSVRVRITEQGRQAIQRVPALLRDRFREELAQLQTWERTQLLASLQRVASMMQAADVAVEPFLYQSQTEPAAAPSPGKFESE